MMVCAVPKRSRHSPCLVLFAGCSVAVGLCVQACMMTSPVF